jgi:hypothetical protein
LSLCLSLSDPWSSSCITGKATPLEDAFKFSFMRRGKAAQQAAAAAAAGKEEEQGQSTEPTVVHPYENSIKTIATVKTVEEFWGVYD